MFFEKIKQSNRRNKFHSRPKTKFTLFAVLATKSIDIMFEKKFGKIKYVNKIYVTLLLYQCLNATKQKNDDCLLSLTTGGGNVAVSVESWF